MKKIKKVTVYTVMTTVVCMSLLIGCGKKDEAPDPEELLLEDQARIEEMAPPAGDGEDSGAGEIAPDVDEDFMRGNPWVEISEQEAKDTIIRLFKVPDGAEVLDWTKCEELGDSEKGISPMVQLNFALDKKFFNARAQMGVDEDTDISGMYVEWTEDPKEVTLANWGGGNMKGKMYRSISDTGYADLITWYDQEIGISYSLSVSAADLDGFDIQAVAEAMYTEDNEAFGYGPTDFVQFQSGRTEFKDYEDVISCLTSGQGYTYVKIKGYDGDILALAELVFEADHSTDEVTLYCMKDGVPYSMGSIIGNGSAYPIRLADGIVYAGDNHRYESYFINPDGNGIMMKDYVDDGVNDGTGEFTGFLRESNDFDHDTDFTGSQKDFEAMLSDRESKPVIEFTVVK